MPFGFFQHEEKSTVNVLMCAGSRVGKTSIMAAMQDNMGKAFPEASVSIRLKQVAGKGQNALDAFRQKQMEAFEDWSSPFYYAEESNQTGARNDSTASEEANDYVGEVRIIDAKHTPKLVNTIRFKDPRGEDFTDQRRQQEAVQWIRSSQVLMIIVDTPRLMECNQNGTRGAFHKRFNKPDAITDLIQKGWQGNRDERLILFVPVKCELYLDQGRGQEIVQRIQEGYAPLITYIRSSFPELCSMAIVPCETMGTLEFRKFEPLGGYDENKPMSNVFHSVYAYRRNDKGQRERKPKNCEQPLLYMLMYLFGMCRLDKGNTGIMGFVRGMPAYADLKLANQKISSKLNRSESNGYYVLNDPQGVFGKII